MEKEMSMAETGQQARIPTEVAEMDGDLFENRPMLVDEWVEIREYIRVHSQYQYLLNKVEPFLIYQPVSDETQDDGKVTVSIFLVKDLDDMEQIAFATMDGDIYEPPEQAPDRQFTWRPILRPLTKGKLVDDSFKKENPTGSKMTGGYVLVNGVLKGTTPEGEVLPLETGTEDTDLRIISTGEVDMKPICWVSFGNILFPTRAFARTTIQNLANIGRLPYPEVDMEA